MSRFEDATRELASVIGPIGLRRVASKLDAGHTDGEIAAETPLGLRTEITRFLDSLRAEERSSAATYLRGIAEGLTIARSRATVEAVWTGPESHHVPVRSTAEVLRSVIDETTRELILMTYSATEHTDIRDALRGAVTRGARISIIVETLLGAGSLLSGAQPALAFTGIGGVELWHWPVAQRHETGARMHAKLAVADRRLMLVSSANLTQSGISTNIEAGLLVRGGEAPARAAEHIDALKARRVLERLRVGDS